MKRRQFSALAATATVALGGIPGAIADASARQTEPLRVEDVSVTLDGLTASVGLAELTFEDGRMQFRVRDATTTGAGRSVTVDEMQVALADVSAETFSTVRAAVVEAVGSRSLSPLIAGLLEADVSPDTTVRVSIGEAEVDGGSVVDEATATGRVGAVVPEGSQALVREGATLAEVADLGPSEWNQLTVQRGDARLVLDDVAMELDGAAFSTSAASGNADLPGRSLQLNDASMTVRPPETIPRPHVQFGTRLRQMAADGTLSAPATRSAAVESGVTAANTSEAVRDARFDLTLGEVTEAGETLVANFETGGTLEELLQVLRQLV